MIPAEHYFEEPRFSLQERREKEPKDHRERQEVCFEEVQMLSFITK